MKKLLEKILGALARAVIRKYRPEVVAVTGSVGKTSTRQAIVAVLSATYHVGENLKNYNNEIGIPLSVIGAPSGGRSVFGWLGVFLKATWLLIWKNKNYPEFLVLEFGADKPGDIKYLCDLVPVKTAVVTAVGEAHLEFFESTNQLAQEKGDIVRALPTNGFAVLNADDPLVLPMASHTKASVVTFGAVAGAHYSASDIKLLQSHGEIQGTSFIVKTENDQREILLPQVVGKHFVSSALAALAVGGIYGLDLATAAAALKNFRTPAGRMKIITGIKHSTIIDDSYNSSPAAAAEALKLLAEIDFGRKKYVALGDMLELGSESKNFHRQLGQKVAASGIDYLVTAGALARDIAAAAAESGMSHDQIFSFDSSVEAGKFLQSRIESGDVILAKGSQGARMEKIVKEIIANPEQAKELLVRQDSAWLKK